MNIEAKIIIFLSPKAFYIIFFYPYKKNGQRQGQTASFKKKNAGRGERHILFFRTFAAVFKAASRLLFLRPTTKSSSFQKTFLCFKSTITPLSAHRIKYIVSTIGESVCKSDFPSPTENPFFPVFAAGAV